MVQVYNTALHRRYYASRCSCAYCLFLIVASVALVLPFFMAYSASGPSFWLKYKTYPETPRVKYNYKVVLVLEGTKADGSMPQTLFFSSVAPLNSMFQGSLRVPVLRTNEVDTDLDGRPEKLELSALVPLSNGEAIYSVKMACFFEYQLQAHAKINMESMGFFSTGSALAGHSLLVDADLEWHQTWPLHPKGGFVTPYEDDPLLDPDSVSPWNGGTGASAADFGDIVRRYRDRNYTTELNAKAVLWGGMSPAPILTNGDGSTFNISATIRYPMQTIMYTPLVSEVLFDAWIRYLSMLVPVLLGLNLICQFIFHHQLVDTYVHTEGVASTAAQSRSSRHLKVM